MSTTVPSPPSPKPAETVRRPAVEIVELLLKAAHLLRAVLTRQLAEFGLSDVRYAVLRIVRDAQPAGCSQTDLAGQLNQSESSISTLVDRMRHDGLLYRLRSKTDRRKRVLMLTHEGRQLLERADARHGGRMDELLARVDAPRQASFRETLDVLVDALAARHAEEKRARPLPSVPFTPESTSMPDDQRRSA